MQSTVIGLEVLFSTIELNNKSDAVVAAIHWSMILAGFRCIGIDDELTLPSSNVVPTELLPPGWNSKSEIYTLKYVDNQPPAVYLIKVFNVGDLLLISALNSDNSEVKSLSVSTDDHITADLNNYHTVFKDLDTLYHLINKEIVCKLKTRRPTAQVDQPSTSQLEQSGQPRDKRTIEEDEDEELYYPAAFRGIDRHDDPLAVGRGDLDPLGRYPGGMLMDPRNFPGIRGPRPPGRSGLPRGAVPPGARFDPFGPPLPGTDRRRNPRFGSPDPDHLPPPGYDDMFG